MLQETHQEMRYRTWLFTTSYTYYKIQQDAQLSQRDRAAGCVI